MPVNVVSLQQQRLRSVDDGETSLDSYPIHYTATPFHLGLHQTHKSLNPGGCLSYLHPLYRRKSGTSPPDDSLLLLFGRLNPVASTVIDTSFTMSSSTSAPKMTLASSCDRAMGESHSFYTNIENDHRHSTYINIVINDACRAVHFLQGQIARTKNVKDHASRVRHGFIEQGTTNGRNGGVFGRSLADTCTNALRETF